MANRQAINHLLHQMMTEAGGIKNYNFRHFFLRNIGNKQTTVEALGEDKLTDDLVHQYTEELEQVKRVAVV